MRSHFPVDVLSEGSHRVRGDEPVRVAGHRAEDPHGARVLHGPGRSRDAQSQGRVGVLSESLQGGECVPRLDDPRHRPEGRPTGLGRGVHQAAADRGQGSTRFPGELAHRVQRAGPDVGALVLHRLEECVDSSRIAQGAQGHRRFVGHPPIRAPGRSGEHAARGGHPCGPTVHPPQTPDGEEPLQGDVGIGVFEEGSASGLRSPPREREQDAPDELRFDGAAGSPTGSPGGSRHGPVGRERVDQGSVHAVGSRRFGIPPGRSDRGFDPDAQVRVPEGGQELAVQSVVGDLARRLDDPRAHLGVRVVAVGRQGPRARGVATHAHGERGRQAHVPIVVVQATGEGVRDRAPVLREAQPAEGDDGALTDPGVFVLGELEEPAVARRPSVLEARDLGVQGRPSELDGGSLEIGEPLPSGLLRGPLHRGARAGGRGNPGRPGEERRRRPGPRAPEARADRVRPARSAHGRRGSGGIRRGPGVLTTNVPADAASTLSGPRRAGSAHYDPSGGPAPEGCRGLLPFRSPRLRFIMLGWRCASLPLPRPSGRARIPCLRAPFPKSSSNSRRAG